MERNLLRVLIVTLCVLLKAGIGYAGTYQVLYTPGEKSWSNAKAKCEERGGYLAVVTSQEEDDQITTFILQETGETVTYIYIGLSDAASEGSWKWVNGETYSYNNWDPREPANNGDYVVKWMGGPNNDVVGAWNDVSEITEFSICEFDSVVTQRPQKTFGIFIGANVPTNDPNYEIKAADDAKEVRKMMVEAGIIESEEKYTMYLRTTDYDDVKVKIANNFDLQPNDLLIFFFSGHGGQSEYYFGETTLTTADEYIQTGNSEITGIRDDQLYKLLNEYPDTYKWVILDSCHSGGFWGNTEENGGDLKRLSRTFFTYAAGENALTPAHPITGRGLLSNTLIKGMSKKDGYMAADIDKNNLITDLEWIIYIQNQTWLNALIGTIGIEKELGDPITITEEMIKFGSKSSPDFDIEMGGYSTSSILNFIPAILAASSDTDCNGTVGGTAVIDECGVCGGDGSTCTMAASIVGLWNWSQSGEGSGTATFSSNGQCVDNTNPGGPCSWSLSGNTISMYFDGNNPWTGSVSNNMTSFTVSPTDSNPDGDAPVIFSRYTDCNGTVGGTAVIDECGVCGGDGSSCASNIPTVTSAGQVWMDRNLGASRVATSSTDSLAYGDLYQWGRGRDGHEKRTSPTTSTRSTTDAPGHGSFINGYDWRNPQNDNLWQGESGINNPCPSGFRLPTETELNIERASWHINTVTGAFSSPTKMVAGGYRNSYQSFVGVGTHGFYWSSTTGTEGINDLVNSRYLVFHGSTNGGLTNSVRANGMSVRCIQD